MEKPNILKKKTHVITTQSSIEEEMSDVKKTEELFDERIISREGDIYTCLVCISHNQIINGEAKDIIFHMRQVSCRKLFIFWH